MSEIKKAYNAIMELYKEKVELELNKKEKEENLKFDLASSCDIRDKKGEPNTKAIKIPLVKAIMDAMDGTPNKKEDEYELMLKYADKINSGEVSVESYEKAIIDLNEISLDLKTVFQGMDLTVEEVTAIEIIAKNRYKELLDAKMEDAGFKKPSAPKEEIDEDIIKNVLKEIDS